MASKISDPAHGTVQFPPSGQPNGQFSYTNNGDLATQDAFYYQACDNKYGACSLATVTITVVTGPWPTVLLPVAVDDEIQVKPGNPATVLIGGSSTVLWNDTDPNNALNDNSTLLAWLIGSPPQHGTLSFNVTAPGDGTFTYTNDGTDPATSDSFEYQACDTLYGACSAATVWIEISNSSTLNHAPQANPDTIVVAHGGMADTLSVPSNQHSVLANDTDSDGDILVAYLVGSKPQHGTLTLNLDGTFLYANDGADPATSDSFEYEACDIHHACTAATVTIQIGSTSGSNPAVSCLLPTQVYLAGTTSPDGTTNVVSIDLSKLFVPPANNTLTYSISGLPLLPPLQMDPTGLLHGSLASTSGAYSAQLKATAANGTFATENVLFDVLSPADHVFRHGFDAPLQHCQ